MTDIKSRFIEIYANLPLGARGEIVLVVDDKPITWNVAYTEVISDTQKSKEILEKLFNIGIIK